MRAPFVVSSITWHEISNKLEFDNINKLEDVLNAQLQLSKYGNGVSGLAFIYIAVQPSNTIHEEMIRYSRKKKEIYIQKKLPFDLVSEYDKAQVLQLMAATYLHTLDELKQKNIPDFDLSRFQQDVRQLFEAQGWLVSESVG